MAIYSVGGRSAAGGASAAYLSFNAGARRARIIEVGVFTVAATATPIGLGHPANTPVASTAVVGQPHFPNDATAVGALGTVWSTAPTAPTAFLKRATLAAAIGAGVVWRFGPGEEIVLENSAGSLQWLVVWNTTAVAASIIDAYFTWEE